MDELLFPNDEHDPWNVDHAPLNFGQTTTGVKRQVECDPRPTMHYGDVENVVL